MTARPSPRRGALLALALGACVTAPHAPTTPTLVADDVREARLALGPVDDVLLPADDPRPRLRALRDLADRLDNDMEATSAAVAVVELSRQRVLVTGDAAEAAATARRELVADVDAAVALLERRKAWWALAQVIDAEPDPARRGRIYLRALEDGADYLPASALEDARAQARTPRQQALVARKAGPGRAPLDRAAVASLGVEFLDLLDGRLATEAAAGDLAAAVASATAIVALDPLHIDARLVLAYDADRRAGRLQHRRETLGAVLLFGNRHMPHNAARAVAVLEHVRESAPLAGSLVLAEAWAMAAVGSAGDAWSLLERTPLDAVTELRDDVRGLLALDAGALATYRVWRDARGGRSSPYVASRELHYLWYDDAPAQQALAEETARRAVEARWPAVGRASTWGVSQAVARDARAPRALRERALASVDVGTQRILRHCLEEALSTASCQRLTDAYSTLHDEDSEGGTRVAIAALAREPALASAWLPAAHWGNTADLVAVAPQIAALEGTAPALTATWVNVAFRVAIARDDVAEATRLHRTYRRMLTPIAEVASRLALADVQAGIDPEIVADALGQLAWAGWPVTDAEPRADEADEPPVAPAAVDPTSMGDTHALASAIQRAWFRPEELATSVAAIRARHPGPELAALDIVVAVARAYGDGADPAPSPPLPEGVPERDLVEALRLRGDRAATRAPLERYLRRRAGAAWMRERLAPAGAKGAAHETTDPVGLAWRALLAGDVDDARAIAMAPNRWAPDTSALPATHPVRRLLDDRAALPDELVHELWRHHTHPDGSTEGAAIALRLLEHPSAGPGSAALACRLLVDAGQPVAAVAPCASAWRGGVVDSDVAVALTWLLVEVPAVTEAHGIDGDALATAARDAAVAAAATDDGYGAVWVNLAHWYEQRGDDARARDLLGAADRAGWTWPDMQLGYDLLDGPRTPFLRALAAARLGRARSGHFERARMALAAGDAAAARWYIAAAESLLRDEEAEERAIEEALADVGELASRDLAARALTEDDIGTWFRAFVAGRPLPPDFVSRHAESALVDTYIAGRSGGPERTRAAERLIERAPENRFAMVRAVGVLSMEGRRADAEKALARARARHPDSALLAAAILGGGRADETWLASPEALDQALRAVTAAEVRALDPLRVTFGAAEAYIPRKKVGDAGIFDLELGGRVALIETPNPTRCKGNQCLDIELRGYDADWTVRWRRELPVAGTTAGQVLFDGPPGTLLLTLVPSGGRLFQLVALLPASKSDAMRPVIRLMHDSVRALDLVVPADRAEALRATAPLPADGIRLAARRGIAGGGCGWVPAGLPEYERSAILLDVALLDPAYVGRATACAEPEHASPALAALAILSEDPAASAFGRRVASDASGGIVWAAQTLLAPGQTQASLDLTFGSERPRRAWLMLAAALPAAGRERAVEVLLGSGTPADRAAGLLIAGLVPTDTTRRRLRDELALAPAGYAQLAIEAMPRPFDAADLAALRRRADRAASKLDAAERRLTATLMRALRDAGDPADRDRVARLARRLSEDPPASIAAPPADGAPLTDDELRTLSLPQLLDRGDWMYARAPQPGAFFAALRELLGRLQVAAAADQYVLHAMLDAGKKPLAILGADGGLDLSRPIECASHGLDGAYVCTATLADPAAIERALAAYPEALASIRAPQVGAFVGGPLSLLAGGAPLFAERAFDEDDEDDDGDGGFPLVDGGGRRVLYERVRLVATVAGRSLVRHLVVSATDDGRSEVEGGCVLVVGDRVFVFSDLAITERVLLGRPAPGASLADDPAFRTEIARWVDGVAIQGLEIKGSVHTSAALVPEADGLRFRMRRVDPTVSPAARAIGLLPPGAGATLAAGSGAAGGSLDDDSLTKALGTRRWLVHHDGEIAFGWYPGASGDDGWIVAARANRKLERSLATRGLGKLGGAVREQDGLFAVRKGAYVIVGSRAELVHAAAARRPGGDARTWVSHLDGPALAQALRARSTAPQRAAAVRVVALFVDLVGSTEASSRRVGGADVLEAVIRPPLARAGDTRDVIDRWLTTPELRNTTRLPRELSATEVERPLAFVIELADARAAAPRLFPATPRTTVTAIDDRHVRVVVTPAPPLTDTIAAAPLDAAARRRALADGADVRTSHARIKTLARQLAPAGTSATDSALRVGAWVHANLRYEVTASGGDAIDVLERGSGDCTEYSLLTVSLLRASGVPAEIRSGVAAGGGELVAHAWVAFHDGTAWREIDPTWGRTSVGADHIETSLLDFVALVSLDRLVIKTVEAAATAAGQAP